MSTIIRLLFSSPPEGVSDEEYHDWYDEHVNDVVTVPGFLAARRYELTARADVSQALPMRFRFLCLYEQEEDPRNIQEYLDEVGRDWRREWTPRLDYAAWKGFMRPGYPDFVGGDLLNIVFSSPPASRTPDQYDAWYAEHMADMLTLEGNIRGWRFDTVPFGGKAPKTVESWRHLAIYEETEPYASISPRFKEARARGELDLPSWYGEISFASLEARPIRPRRTAD